MHVCLFISWRFWSVENCWFLCLIEVQTGCLGDCKFDKILVPSWGWNWFLCNTCVHCSNHFFHSDSLKTYFESMNNSTLRKKNLFNTNLILDIPVHRPWRNKSLKTRGQTTNRPHSFCWLANHSGKVVNVFNAVVSNKIDPANSAWTNFNQAVYPESNPPFKCIKSCEIKADQLYQE